MVNTKLLRESIDSLGMSISFVAKQIGISRESLYQKMNGETEFKASEIYALKDLLRLDNNKRDAIFFDLMGDFESHQKERLYWESILKS